MNIGKHKGKRQNSLISKNNCCLIGGCPKITLGHLFLNCAVMRNGSSVDILLEISSKIYNYEIYLRSFH